MTKYLQTSLKWCILNIIQKEEIVMATSSFDKNLIITDPEVAVKVNQILSSKEKHFEYLEKQCLFNNKKEDKFLKEWATNGYKIAK
jgi:hypothetical protein